MTHPEVGIALSRPGCLAAAMAGEHPSPRQPHPKLIQRIEELLGIFVDPERACRRSSSAPSPPVRRPTEASPRGARRADPRA